MTGIILDSKYRLDKKIGRGGFGDVYRGFDLNLKRTIAVKILGSVGEKEDFKKRFLREAESLAKMKHPNIVTVYDCGQHNERPYIVMELINGPSLHQLVTETQIAAQQIGTMADQICSAMSYAHEQGIIHRDLTLKNIMLNEEEGKEIQVKILDFGLVKLLDYDQTTGKSMMGTPLYLSPEQVIGADVDNRADIFAFGVGLYRIMNGYFPFEGEHPAALMYSIVNEEPKEYSEDVPEDVKMIISKCLEKDPRERYRSFSEIAEELKMLRWSITDDAAASTSAFGGLNVIAERGSKRNPFLNRVMINNPADFYGRKKEIRKIYSRLDAPHPQSISVVGERRIGKSSLLNFIYNRKNRKRNMQNYENSVFVYLDFQKSVDFDVPKFIDYIFNIFGYETNRGRAYKDRPRNLDQLKEVIQELHDEKRRVIVLMDEFEIITNNANFEEEFFSFLRSLANSYRVAYVTSSCNELQLMCHNKDISDSPFFNIFSNLPLRSFGHDEAIELITKPSETEGIPLEKYANNIIGLAGYFPFFLQIACSNAFEHLIEHPDTEPDWEQISKSYKDEAFPHYNFIWDRMDEDDKTNLVRIAEGKRIDRKYRFINERLIRNGYLLEDTEQQRIFSPTFTEFIESQKGSAGRSIFSSIFKKSGDSR